MTLACPALYMMDSIVSVGDIGRAEKLFSKRVTKSSSRWL